MEEEIKKILSELSKRKSISVQDNQVISWYDVDTSDISVVHFYAQLVNWWFIVKNLSVVLIN